MLADANKTKEALSYVPVVLQQLDNTGKEMLADIMQALLEVGYENGFKDGQGEKKGD